MSVFFNAADAAKAPDAACVANAAIKTIAADQRAQRAAQPPR